MDIFLVGGAVRDQILGLDVSERDWVIVGGTPEALIQEGFRPVGKDFPVFLHPETHEEYALARTERKTRPGYHGFEFDSGRAVTLEEDLARRDLTINAIAQGQDGHLVDPYGGLQDLKARKLRHVTPAFSEDPVRILRVARFMARFKPMGFELAPETLALMKDMVQCGEVDALVPERVLKELMKGLKEPQPSAFFETLDACGALHRIFPEWGSPKATLAILDWSAHQKLPPEALLAIVLHDLGAGELSPPRPQKRLHHLVRLSERLRLPTRTQRLAIRVVRYLDVARRVLQISPGATLDLLQRLDAFRQPDLFALFLTTLRLILGFHRGQEVFPCPEADRLETVRDACAKIPVEPLMARGLKGEALAKAIRSARIQRIETIQNANRERPRTFEKP